LFDQPAVAAVTCAAAVRTRERAARSGLRPNRIDAIVLAAAVSVRSTPPGAQAWLRERGRGFQVRAARVPIVPAAIH
jgi:L-aminopeptidase/D-esterase-like protein